jgi:hypothetical protein
MIRTRSMSSLIHNIYTQDLPIDNTLVLQESPVHEHSDTACIYQSTGMCVCVGCLGNWLPGILPPICGLQHVS